MSIDKRAQERIEKLLGVGDQPSAPEDPTPIERMLAAAAQPVSPLTLDETPVFPPWEPTGDESPKKTVELDRDSATPYTVPPPETAGGSIPSAYAQFRKFGPDES